MPTIQVSDYARRQTTASQFSHYAGDIDMVAALALACFGAATTGYREGVLLVPVPAADFFSGVVTLEEGAELSTTFAPRYPGEEPHQQTTATGTKLPANLVTIVLYSKELLAEGGDAATGADYDVISINAEAEGVEGQPAPLTPFAMARNAKGLKGGTPATYTAEELLASILYWNRHAMRTPE